MKKTTIRVLFDIVLKHSDSERARLISEIEDEIKLFDLSIPGAEIQDATIETIIMDDLSLPQYPASQMQHVANNGTLCPCCGSAEIQAGSIELNEDRVTHEVFCLDCDAEWDDIYLFSGYDNLK